MREDHYAYPPPEGRRPQPRSPERRLEDEEATCVRYPDHAPAETYYPGMPTSPPVDLADLAPQAPAPGRSRAQRGMRFVLKEILLPLTMAIMLALVIQATVAKPYEIPTGSMMPTIQPSERVLANRFVYHIRDIERGDIIVFQPPPELASPVPFVKRVIGLPGDTVEVRGGQVLVNGEPFVVDGATIPAYGYDPRVVPEGMLFVLGDNRNNSVDSHEWDFLPADQVIGEVFMTYWPLDRLRLL